MAAEENNSNACCNLGSYYYRIGEVEKMIKYYILSIQLGNNIAMCNLGEYYEHIHNYENMIKYYLLAHQHGNMRATLLLRNFCNSLSMKE